MWIATEILKETNLEQQLRLIVLFIDTAKHCMMTSNYNTAAEILTTFQFPCIRKMQSVWKVNFATFWVYIDSK